MFGKNLDGTITPQKFGELLRKLRQNKIEADLIKCR